MLKDGRMRLTLITILLAVFLIQQGGNGDWAENLTYWKERWETIRGGKLEVLSEEEEKRILEETDRLLRETKTVFFPNRFLLFRVCRDFNSGFRRGYVNYGNKIIREKMLEMFKRTYQCSLKQTLYLANQRKEKTGIVSEEVQENLRFCETTLNKLIQRDGDLCPDCMYCEHLNNVDVYKMCKELLKEDEQGICVELYCYYDNLLRFLWRVNSFEPGMYDYLWFYVGSRRQAIDAPCDDYDLVNFATVNAEKFINDISNCSLEELKSKDTKDIYSVRMPYYVYKSEFEKLSLSRAFLAFMYMLELNPEVAEQRKIDIKVAMRKHVLSYITARDKFYAEYNWRENKGGYYMMHDVLNKDVEYRRWLMSIYEKLATKEDIESIKGLIENFLEFPLWDEGDVYAQTLRSDYIERVTNLKERAHRIVEKISQ